MSAALSRLELLVVHRPKYDDWTFPKGKTDPGEELPVTAVREVEEETGARVRLGVPLRQLSYDTDQGRKDVSYWSARVTGGAEAADYQPNDEIDEVRWVLVDDLPGLLSYERDQEVLDAFGTALARGAHKSRTLLVVRHAEAEDREDWSGDDLDRPLNPAGIERARDLVQMFAAYGVERVVSSDAARCIETVQPYVHRVGAYVAVDRRLAQKPSRSAGKPKALTIVRAVDELRQHKTPALACSHRPVLPWILESLGQPDAELAPGEMVVVHHRRGDVLAVEIHRLP